MKPEHNRINILFLAAEADPLVKIGGLGDVAGTLPVAINRIAGEKDYKVEVRVVIPFHRVIKDKKLPITHIGTYTLRSAKGPEEVEVYEYISAGTVIYLIDGKPIRSSPVPYSNDIKADADKYVFFSLASIHLPEFLNWPVDIIHANDWHSALAVYSVKKVEGHLDDGLKTIQSVHNLPFMGNGSEATQYEYGISEYHHPHLPGWARNLPLPMGLAAADLIIPVSPGYAKEIQTSEYGCGLENFLSWRHEHIKGILNGIDTMVWDPGTDPAIPTPFTLKTAHVKSNNKRILQTNLELHVDSRIPLMAVISRLDFQKGIDLIVEGLYRLTHPPKWQCIILGTGDPYLEMQVRNLAKDKPDQVRAVFEFDQNLAHLIYAGADIFLMPSRYEPCGISQMISQRYGTIPVARATGGLKDTISPATGYLFDDLNSTVFASKVTRTLSDYQNPEVWNQMMQSAMKQDFSWGKSAREYIHEYYLLLGKTI